MATSQIATNMAAVRTHNVFAKNNANMTTALDRVTTGLKINSAKDGVAQYVISEKMRERINSNQQASQNVQNGSAMARTASSGLDNTLSILKTLKARAIDAANDSNTDDDREIIQNDITKLLDQIDYNSKNIQYNGKVLLDGRYDGEKVREATTTAYLTDVDDSKSSTNLKDLSIITGSQKATLVVSWLNGGKSTEDDSIYTLDTGTTLQGVITAANAKFDGFAIKQVNDKAEVTKDKNGESVLNETGAVKWYAVSDDTGKASQFSGMKIEVISNSDPTKKLTIKASATALQEGKNQNTDGIGLSFHIGESSDMSTDLKINDMSAAGLNIQAIDVTTQKDAKYSITAIDAAIQKVLDEQTSIGSVEARLGYTADALDTINENLQASDSTIRDSDMAKEISNYMKYSVLSQASQYMLAQSHQNAYQLLNLLQ